MHGAFAAAALMVLALFAGLACAPAVAHAAEASTQDMYRLYNPNSGEHFYTASAKERYNLIIIGWRNEGIGWTAPVSSNTPVYRLYNPNVDPTTGSGEHHYTTDANERNTLIAAGWTDEGIGWYSDDEEGVPLYRQYNPNAYNCNHNYTTDANERDTLIRAGWRDEGIAWYGVSSGSSSSGASGSGNGSSNSSNGSGDGSSDGSSSGVLEPEYDYDIQVLNKHSVLDGMTTVLYVKTENPRPSFQVKDTTGSYAIEGGVHYADIDANWKYNNDGKYTLESGNGYIMLVSFDEPGDHVFEIREWNSSRSSYGDPYEKTFTVHVGDYDAAEEEWLNGVLREYASQYTDSFDKVEAVWNTMLDTFSYSGYVDADGNSVYLASRIAPYWESHKLNSYSGPAAMCRWAELIGGFDEIHNCYGDYEYGTTQWQMYHAYVRLTIGDEARAYICCPAGGKTCLTSWDMYDI